MRNSLFSVIFKPPPPVGAPAAEVICFRVVRPCRCPCVRPSVIHVVVLCFRDISSICCICWRIFAKLLSLVHLGHRWPDYVFGSKGQSSMSHHRGGAAQHSTLPSSATFSSLFSFLFYFYMFEWCSLLGLCVDRMGTSIDGRKPFWLPASCMCFSVRINSLICVRRKIAKTTSDMTRMRIWHAHQYLH